ncbi:MAG: hypothetical protein HY906_22005 [Deltaproteobacteria bacterium]|nr:hypothetical protein [Deltaproteobacteria bacterium]
MLSVVRPLLVAAALCVAIWLPLACGGGGELRDASQQGGSYARIAVTYVHRHGDPAGRVQLAVEGQFVRYRNVEADGIEALLGAGPQELRRGECRVVDRRARTGAAFSAEGPEAEVALLDAGDLLVRGPSGHSALQARRFPDLVPFVAGVYYSETEPPLDLEQGPTGEVQIVGVGGAEVGPFAAAVPLPFDVPLCEASWVGTGIELRWAPGGEPEGLRLDVRDARGEGARAVSCAAADDGGFTVPAALLHSLGTREVRVSAERLRRQPFVSAGVAAGEIVVSLRDTSELTLPLPETKPR